MPASSPAPTAPRPRWAGVDAFAIGVYDGAAFIKRFFAELFRPPVHPLEIVKQCFFIDHTTYASLTATVGDLQHAGARASEVMDKLARGAADPNTPFGTLIQDQRAGADLKGTLGNLNRSTVLLSDDLEALQHKLLFRGFFRRRERAAAKARAVAESGAVPAPMH